MKNNFLQSKRLQLRFLALSDLQMVHEFHSIPEVDEFNTLGIPANLDETRSIIEPWIVDNNLEEIRNYTFIIEHSKSEKFIGLFGFKLGSKKYQSGEVWYKIHPEHWNKGYATEALRTIIRFGFGTLKLHRIDAGCAVENIGSIKVLENAGMSREGRRRKILPLKSGWSDNYEYSILDTDQ